MRERESRRREKHYARGKRSIWRRRLQRHHHLLLLLLLRVVEIVVVANARHTLAIKTSTKRWENHPQSGCHHRYHHREKIPLPPIGDKNGRRLSPGTPTDWTGKEEEVLKPAAERTLAAAVMRVLATARECPTTSRTTRATFCNKPGCWMRRRKVPLYLLQISRTKPLRSAISRVRRLTTKIIATTQRRIEITE